MGQTRVVRLEEEQRKLKKRQPEQKRELGRKQRKAAAAAVSHQVPDDRVAVNPSRMNINWQLGTPTLANITCSP